MVARGKKVSGCEIKIWLDYAICGGLWGALNVYPWKFTKRKKLDWKEGDETVVEFESRSQWVSGGTGECLTRVTSSRHQNNSKNFIFIILSCDPVAVCQFRIKCQFSEKSPALADMMLWDCLHDTGYQRGYHLDIWPTEEISLARLFSVTILSPCQGLKCPLPPPSWPMVQQTLESMRVSHCDDPHYELNNGETYLKQTREHINIRVAAQHNI